MAKYICENCKKEVSEIQGFCGSCGAKFDKEIWRTTSKSHHKVAIETKTGKAIKGNPIVVGIINSATKGKKKSVKKKSIKKK